MHTNGIVEEERNLRLMWWLCIPYQNSLFSTMWW